MYTRRAVSIALLFVNGIDIGGFGAASSVCYTTWGILIHSYYGLGEANKRNEEGMERGIARWAV